MFLLSKGWLYPGLARPWRISYKFLLSVALGSLPLERKKETNKEQKKDINQERNKDRTKEGNEKIKKHRNNETKRIWLERQKERTKDRKKARKKQRKTERKNKKKERTTFEGKTKQR